MNPHARAPGPAPATGRWPGDRHPGGWAAKQVQAVHGRSDMVTRYRTTTCHGQRRGRLQRLPASGVGYFGGHCRPGIGAAPHGL